MDFLLYFAQEIGQKQDQVQGNAWHYSPKISLTPSYDIHAFIASIDGWVKNSPSWGSS
jgi:hypothetical protein